jgi:hypothetical protein
MGSSQNAANEGSLLSEEQKETAHGNQNVFRHLLSALQFAQERQGIFFNRRSTRIHKVPQEGTPAQRRVMNVFDAELVCVKVYIDWN